MGRLRSIAYRCGSGRQVRGRRRKVWSGGWNRDSCGCSRSLGWDQSSVCTRGQMRLTVVVEGVVVVVYSIVSSCFMRPVSPRSQRHTVVVGGDVVVVYSMVSSRFIESSTQRSKTYGRSCRRFRRGGSLPMVSSRFNFRQIKSRNSQDIQWWL